MRLPPRETGRGDGGDGSDGCEAGDGEERADCRLSNLVFDADSAEESPAAQCGGDGEGGRAGVGSDEGEGGDGDDGCDGGRAASAASGERSERSESASSVSHGRGRGGGSCEERSWMKLVSPVPKRADAQREMRRQNGQRETKFLFSSGRDDFSLSESFCKTAATALIRIVESCLGCI